jgi:hypothetical protein
VRIAAHGIELELPRNWEGRLYRVAGSAPILHAASFALPAADGDFGSGATGAIPAGGAFLALKEYDPGPRLRPGVGLFQSRVIPLPLTAGHFHPRALQVGRPGQAGLQHFFTASRRPFCLYAVIATTAAGTASIARAHDRVGQLSGILTTLKIEERH